MTAVVSAAAAGVCVGALAQYLLDPERGRTRRTQLRQRSTGVVRRPVKRARNTASQRVTYLRGRVQGTARQIAPEAEQAKPEGRKLVDKIRSEVLGDPRFRKHAINLEAANGVVTVRGEIGDQDTIRDLVSSISKVPGVRRVENLLHAPRTTAPNVRGLQQPSS